MSLTLPSSSSPASSPAGAGAPGLRARAYLRTGRTIRFENFLGTLVVWSLLPAPRAFTHRTLELLALTLAVAVAIVAAGGTLDDIRGYRDGSDRENYERSDPTGLRPMTRKPLLLGWITERQAVAYARRAATTAAVLIGLAWMAAGRQPVWVLAGYAAVMALAVQYSWGVNLSYHGAQELTLLAVAVGSIVLPASLITRRLDSTAVVEALIFAAWFVQVSIFSNSHDAAGDRSHARWTVAAMTSERANRRFLTAVFVAGWALVGSSLAAGWAPAALAVAAVSVLPLQAGQLWHGAVRGHYLAARHLGFWVLRLGLPLVIVINIWSRWR